MALTKLKVFMAAQQCVSEGMKSPIYNLLHVFNYPDHQRWEKNINPQTFVGHMPFPGQELRVYVNLFVSSE